jgi:hypothetical protein
MEEVNKAREHLTKSLNVFNEMKLTVKANKVEKIINEIENKQS